MGHTPLILALGKQRQVDHYRFEGRLVYIVRSRSVKVTQ